MGCGVSDESSKSASLPSNDNYERGQLIGLGHHGKVYKTMHSIDSQWYAEKVIDQLRTDISPQHLKEVSMSLVGMLHTLRHQKLASYLKPEFKGKELSVVMELSEGGTLKNYIQSQGKMSEQEVVEIVKQILEGLQYLHHAGMLHKDLKPSNILMNGLEIKLSDYALVELVDSRLSANKKGSKLSDQLYRVDSLPFMAPQVIKDIQVTQKSDVWSLGCVILEMLTGRLPWSHLSNNWSQQFSIISDSTYPPLPSDLSQNCQSFLQACMALAPTQRSSVEDLMQHSFITGVTHSTALEFTDTFYKPQEDFTPQTKPEGKSAVTNHDYSSDLDQVRRALRSIGDTIKKRYGSRNQSRNHSRVMSRNKEQRDESKEEDEDGPMVMLNNRPVRMDRRYFKKSRKRIQTEASADVGSIRPNRINASRVMTDDIEMVKVNPLNNRSVTFQDSLDAEINTKAGPMMHRIETEPINYQDKQYFKKPLKILKKKLKESKIAEDLKRRMSVVVSEVNGSQVNANPTTPVSDRQHHYRLPLRRDEAVINTALAQAERERYHRQQDRQRCYREQEKVRWEQELKEGAKLMNLAFGNLPNPISHNL